MVHQDDLNWDSQCFKILAWYTRDLDISYFTDHGPMLDLKVSLPRRDESCDTNRYKHFTTCGVHENIDSIWSNTCMAAYVYIYICVPSPTKTFQKVGFTWNPRFPWKSRRCQTRPKKDGFGTRPYIYINIYVFLDMCIRSMVLVQTLHTAWTESSQ